MVSAWDGGWGWGVLLWLTSQEVCFFFFKAIIKFYYISFFHDSNNIISRADYDPSNVTKASESNNAAVPDGVDCSEEPFLHCIIVDVTNLYVFFLIQFVCRGMRAWRSKGKSQE